MAREARRLLVRELNGRGNSRMGSFLERPLGDEGAFPNASRRSSLRSSDAHLRLRLLPLFVVCLRFQLSAAVTPLSDWNEGIATNYGGPFDGKNPSDPSWGTLNGACGYGQLDKGKWPYWSVAALSTQNRFYLADNIKGCGQCFEIKCVDRQGGEETWTGRCYTGPEQVSVIVQITDECPECKPDHIDIQAMTFEKLAPMHLGRVNIQYRRVECVPPSNLVVYADQNYGPDKWLRLFVEQAGGKATVKQVKIRTAGASDWINLENKWGGAFEYSHAPTYPLDVMIVGDDGPVVAHSALNSGSIGKATTGVQFYITNPTDTALVYKIGDVGGGSYQAAQSVSVSSSSSSSSSDGNCYDVPSTDQWSCQDQKNWGHCDADWMKAGNDNTGSMGFCAQTCGRCSVSTGGRRLLRA
eukprot:jgi/Botrbrau1/10372/Bobra.146_2s0010.1